MIKILFDHEIFSEQRFGGISRYFANLKSEISKDKNFKIDIAVLYSKNYYIRNFNQLLNNSVGRWFLRKDTKRYRWNKKYSKYLLKKADYDIFHATYYDTYSLKYINKPLVITIHDMIHENNPEMFVNSTEIISQKKHMMDASHAIIAISNFTKNEILKFYPQFEPKISVVYHGLPEEMSTGEKVDIINESKYILYVGQRGHYKNFSILAAALTPLLKNEKDLKLLCAGGGKFSTDEQDMLNQYGINKHCLQIDANDETLKDLYQQALVFAYPSSQEGFGLPMLEAFKNNCPIVCSNVSCLPEIGGEAVQYFNPEEESSILSAVEQVILNATYAQELIIKGQERLSHFTMEECILNTKNVYKKVLNR
jgi:glycosyltransferase involved in cell wall biosynthesis